MYVYFRGTTGAVLANTAINIVLRDILFVVKCFTVCRGSISASSVLHALIWAHTNVWRNIFTA